MANYFLHLTSQRSPIFWRAAQVFAGITIHINLNMLSSALGDSVSRPPRPFSRVPTQVYSLRNSLGQVSIQPKVIVSGTSFRSLPIGPNLRNFLNYPLGGTRKMDLRLPIYDSTLGIGDSGGGWFRQNDNDSAYHGGIDITQGSNGDLFEVCAAKRGEIIGIGNSDNAPIVLKHTLGSSEFLTVYQHLNLRRTRFQLGDIVTKGQLLAPISGKPGTPHLHFMVAVKAPSPPLSLGFRAALWYAIDPFGVYDYYKNRTSPTRYNYLPDRRPNCFSNRIQGAAHFLQWANNPVIESLI